MKRYLSRLERVMLALTFAESNCPETARNYLVESGVGRGGVRVAGGGSIRAEGNRCR